MKISLFFIVFVLVYFSGLSGCTSAEKSSVNVPEVLETGWQQFIDAWENEDAAACASLYQVDALHVPHGLPVNRGREAIQAFYAFLFDANRSSR